MSHLATHKFRLDLSRLALRSLTVVSLLMLMSVTADMFTKPAHAFDGGIVPKSGYVTTRGLALDEATGKPVYAEIMADGQYGVTYGPAVDDMADAYVISADQYRAIVGLFDDISARPEAQGAYVLTRERYQNIQRTAGNFGTIEVPVLGSETPESIPVPAPDIDATTKSVLIRANSTIEDPRALPVGQGPILLEAPINVSNTAIRRDLSPDTKSVLVSKNGDVLQTSIHDIGFKSRFIKRLSNDDPGASESTANLLNFRPGDRAAGPVAFAYVDAGLGYTYSPAYTDATGQFRLNMYIPRCPGFFWSHDFNLWARLNYRNFDPEAPGGNQPRHYYFTRPYSQTCNGLGAFPPSYSLTGLMAMINVRSIIATQATPMIRADFFIDVVMLNGKGTLQNPGAGNITATDGPTEYTYAAPAFTPQTAQNIGIQLDLDQDNREDWQILNPDDPRLVDVYLGGRTNTDVDADGNPIAPDLQRVADVAQDFSDQGLLSNINKDALKDTDLYVYRVATGQLVTKMEGLDPRQVIPADTGFSYKIIIPGPVASRNDFSPRRFRAGYLGDWQESLGMPEDMRGRQADALRPGETVQIIAINRPTGYIGSANAIIQQAGGAGSNPGRLDFDIPDIVLQPPNLKVQVKRSYRIAAGLTRGDTANYRIGFEGSALASDTIVELSTEWVDHNGSPLPEDLEGYTGQLAKVVGPNVLGGSGVADFPIKPGKHLQVVRLQGDILGPEHFYVHVFGKPDWRNLGPGAGTGGPLQYRPKNYVPVKVPLYDEVTTQRLRNIAVAEGRPVSEVEPVYRWAYRPEMQFSVFDLTMREINRTDADGNVVDIYPAGADDNPATIPGFASGDQLAQLLYNLNTNTNAPLIPFGPERQLIFALGEEEVIATMGENQTLQFDNLDHLSQLSVEDFLSIRLYQNSDSANILWEFAFDTLFIAPVETDKFNEIDLDKHYLTADNPVLELVAGLGSDINAILSETPSPALHWFVEGDGVLASSMTTATDVVLSGNVLIMPTTAGASATVKVRVVGGNSSLEASYKDVVVLPGEPNTIALSVQGDAGIQGAGELVVEATVVDQHGNPVVDGTPISFEIKGQARLSDAGYILKDGKAIAIIKGGFLPEQAGTVYAVSGNAYAESSFSISGVQAQLLGVPATTTVDSYHELTLSVTGADGGAREGVYIDLTTTRGKLAYTDQNYKTDANGEVHVLWHSGLNLGDATITARIGGLQLLKQVIAVETADGLPADYINILPDDALVLGDQTVDGSVAYDNVTGHLASVTLPYQVSEQMVFDGTPGSTINVKLGTDAYPNFLPELVLNGYRLKNFNYYDDTGQHKLDAVNMSQVEDHPSGIGKSFKFTPGSDTALHAKINVEGANLNNPGEWSWRMSVKPLVAGGTLIRFGDAQILSVNAAGELTLSVSTSAGTQSIQSVPLTLGDWHQVIAKAEGGSLILIVDGQQVSSPLAGTVSYTGTSSGAMAIVIGDGFNGHIANITYYDLESSPLLQFADGTYTKQQVLDGAGQAEVSVQATGEFKYLTSSNPLARMRVGIVANDSISGINLISTDEYQQLASLSYDVLGAVQTFDRFKELYAGSGSYGTEQTLAERLLAFVMDHTRVDIHLDGYKELTALKGVLSLLRRIPEARPLVPHVQTLIDYFNSQGEVGVGATLTYAAADEIYKRLQPALRGQAVDLEEITLPLLVLAEMISAVPTAADRLASTIVSAEDFKTWMRFLSLPAEGWVGYEPPIPPLNSQCGDSANYQIVTSTPELSLPLLPCRMTGVRAGTLINAFFNESPALVTNPEMLPPVLFELLDHLPYADIYIRKYLFSAPQLQLSWLDDMGLVKEAQAIFPAIIIGAIIRYAVQQAAKQGVKKAVKNLVSFMLGKSNSRIQPLLLLASIGYLESRITGEGCGAAGENCVLLDEGVAEPIHSLERKLLLNILFRGRASDKGIDEQGELICGFMYDTHGAAFELFMTAFFHLLHEQRGLPEYEIIALQKRNEVVPIGSKKGEKFSQAPSQDTAQAYATFIRYTDIVLKGDTDKPWYIELKSYPAHDKRSPNHNDDVTKSKINAKFPLWKRGGKRRTTVHRQLIMDAILMRDNFEDTGIEATKKQAADFRWYFQDWQPTRQQSNLKLRHPGNSVTKVEVAGRNMTAFQYIREERLSRLGHEKNPGTQRFVAWNLGRPTDLALPANRTMYNYVIDAGDGGLKKRVKKFSLLSVLAEEPGDEVDQMIDREGLLQALKDGLGMDARVADMIENPEKYEDLVMEHLNRLGTGLARELEELTGLEGEDVKETYEKILKHYQQLSQETGKIEEQIDKALEEILEAIPNSGADQCF